MLKQYLYRGSQWQFEEGKQPKGAIEIAPPKEKPEKAEEPEKKAVTPKNKARKAANK